MRSIPLLSIVSLLALTASIASAAEAPSHPFNPDAPWALELDDTLSKPVVEQWYGPEVAAEWQQVEPRWDGDQLLTRESFDERLLSSLGVSPVPAMNYEPAPGVVYVAMDGVTLRPTCGNGDSAHSALDCTPLVDSEVTLPAFGARAAAEFEQLRNYYAPFDLVMTSSRPPDWMPYTMAVIGGASEDLGHGFGNCGVANVVCDGLERNHISLNFPETCRGMAESVGQEAAHTWGLEHTNNLSDIMYPFNEGASTSFIDECMPLNHATGTGITQCGYIHEIYCGDDEQNSFAEMMGVFGPATEDVTAPDIVSVFPADGAQLGSAEEFTVTATIEENSRMVAVRWSWIGGLPEGTDSYTRCTNNVCDNDFNPGVSFVASEVQWDFVTLSQPPVGTYSFLVEALDAYGNYDSEMIEIEVVEGDGVDDGGSADGGVDGGSDDGASGGTGGGSGGGETVGESGAAADGDGGGGVGAGGCRIVAPAAPGWGAVLLGVFALLSRRRRREC